MTLISTLHASGGRLPEDHAQLYQNSVELLLYPLAPGMLSRQRRPTVKAGPGRSAGCLQSLAYHVHKAQQQRADAGQAADIDQTAMLTAFASLLRTLGSDDLLLFLQPHSDF